MFGNFSIMTQKLLVDAKIERDLLKHPYVGSEHLLLAMLKENTSVTSILNLNGVTYDNFRGKLIEIVGTGKEESEYTLYTPLLKRILECAIIESNEHRDEEVSIEHLFTALLEEGDGVAMRILLSLDVDFEELYDEFDNNVQTTTNKKTLKLDEFGVNLNLKAVNKGLDKVVGREKEISRIIEILCRRTKNNPILVGKPGVGKTAIVEGLVNKIIEKDVPSKLLNKKVYSLEMASLVAGTKYRGEFEEKLKKIINEIESDPDIIVFIDEVHTLVKAGGAEGAIDASNILKPALARGSIRLIGATTEDEYKKYIENDGALDRRFQKVSVTIPSKVEVINILNNIKETYEVFHGVLIDDYIIESIVDLASKYIFDRNEPDRSIDVLDEVMSMVSIRDSNQDRISMLQKEISEISNNINVALKENRFDDAIMYSEKLKEKEKEKVSSSSNEIRSKIEYDDVIDVISNKVGNLYRKEDVISRVNVFRDELKEKLELKDDNFNSVIKVYNKMLRSIKSDNLPYSILISGFNCSGKSSLASMLSKSCEIEEHIIKLNMDEYSSKDSITKLVGSNPGYIGYEDKSYVFDKVKRYPKCVIILEGLERADSSILEVFKGILRTGEYRDNRDNLINFSLCNFIITSSLIENTSIGYENEKKHINSLPTEVLDLIDDVIEIEKVDETDARKIVNKKLESIKTKYELSKIKLKFNTEIANEITELCDVSKFGVSKMDKIIKNKVINKVTDEIILDKDVIKIESIN